MTARSGRRPELQSERRGLRADRCTAMSTNTCEITLPVRRPAAFALPTLPEATSAGRPARERPAGDAGARARSSGPAWLDPPTVGYLALDAGPGCLPAAPAPHVRRTCPVSAADPGFNVRMSHPPGRARVLRVASRAPSLPRDHLPLWKGRAGRCSCSARHRERRGSRRRGRASRFSKPTIRGPSIRSLITSVTAGPASRAVRQASMRRTPPVGSSGQHPGLEVPFMPRPAPLRSAAASIWQIRWRLTVNRVPISFSKTPGLFRSRNGAAGVFRAGRGDKEGEARGDPGERPGKRVRRNRMRDEEKVPGGRR